VQFRGVASCSPGRGDTISFWEDIINGQVGAEVFPNLYAYANNPKVSLWKLRNSGDLLHNFRIPMSRQAYNEFLLLQNAVSGLPPVSPHVRDVWHFIWGTQSYSSHRFYQHHFSSLQPQRSVVWIWKSKCLPKIKFFGWLLLNDRLNTRNMLRRRNKFLEEGYNCVLCQNHVEETLEHLFFDCPAATARWFAIGIAWDDAPSLHERIYRAKDVFQGPLFMEVFLIAAWCLWNERNGVIFNKKVPSLGSWKDAFKEETKLLLYRIKSSLHPTILSWLSAL
jgi:hypothetical protein